MPVIKRTLSCRALELRYSCSTDQLRNIILKEVFVTSKRSKEEAKEKLPIVNNDAPEQKYQGTQQTAESTGFSVNAGKGDFAPKREECKGSSLKQEVASKVIKEGQFGGSLSGDGMSFAGLRSSGGNNGGTLGAANATPVAGQSRGTDRVTKKNDRNSTKLNYIPCDVTLTTWDESKPLAEAKDKDQGFNGTYRNEYARSQKNKEAVPGALMFDRSIDLLVKDNVYFGAGQVVKQTGVTRQDDIDQTATQNTAGIFKYPASEATVNYQGGVSDNFLTTGVKMQLASDGKPTYVVYEENQYSANVDSYDANKSSVQNLCLMNDAELCRESIDTKAGDEKADIWSPLARATRKPTQLVGFLRDLEGEVGDEVLTAYRKASTSMSYQLNVAHKDGQNAVDPAIRALMGLNKNYVSKAAQVSDLGSDLSAIFTADNYRNGEAQTMIALYDSITKYNTKADFLIQPRGFRLHLQTADNNMDPLRTHKLFNQVYDNQETFSTIDREYDPMAPVCLTDKAGVIHRHSWHKLGSYVMSDQNFVLFDKGAVTSGSQVKTTLLPKEMVTELKDGGYSLYFITVKDANGSLQNSNNTISPSSGFNFAGGSTFNIQMIIAKDAPTIDTNSYEMLTVANADLSTLYDLIWDGRANNSHCYYIKSIGINVNAEKIYAYQAGPLVYTYHDLRNNYVVTVKHPLLEGFDKYIIEQIGPKYESITHKSGEIVAPIHINTIHSTMFYSLWSFMICAAVPYIVKERINSMRDVIYYQDNVEYPFSSTLIPVKDILTKAYTNFGYKDYDTELEVRRMTPVTAINWMLPETFQQVGYASSEVKVLMPWYTNQNSIRYINGSYAFDDDASVMSFPSIRSGVRLASLDNLYGMDEKDVRLSIDAISSFKSLVPTLANSRAYKYSVVGDGQLILSIDPGYATAYDLMCLPRELGFFMTAPYGTLTPNYNHARDYAGSILGCTSFRCYYWYGASPISTDDQGNESILQPINININRAQNFVQDWYCVLASGTIPAVDHGFFLSYSHAFAASGGLLAGRTSFKPYASLADDGTASTTNMNALRSLQKALWTRIQKLPFIISPFDGLTLDNTGSPNNVILNDPYDFLYAFGLGGFRASDYRESVYNREKQFVNQGILFVVDPWVADSPVFREGATSSGIVNSTGFEL